MQSQGRLSLGETASFGEQASLLREVVKGGHGALSWTFHLFGALAAFERNLSRERTMAGLKAARERGCVGGRPFALDEDEIPQVQAMMRDKEISTSDICERFDISRATLYRYVGPEGQRRR